MDGDAVLTVAVLAVMGAGLISNRLSPASGVLGAVGGLFLLGVIDADDAFGGFANPAPITIGALYVVAGAVTKTNALQPLVARMLDRGSGARVALLRLLAPASAASAFLANTPIVAMLVPAVRGWAERHGRAASRFLIPLSYATILGGAITAIGTSTNLVLGGLLQSVGQDELEMFELARFGLPLAGAGLLLTVGGGPVAAARPTRSRGGWRGPFLSGVDACGGAGGVRRAVGGGRGLRHLEGVFLVEVERQGTVIAPVAPTFVLRGGDRLTFAGRVDLVLDLQAMSGLASAEDPHLEAVDSDDHTFFEAVVGAASPLSGRTLPRPGFGGAIRPQWWVSTAPGHRWRPNSAKCGCGSATPCWSWPPTASTSGGGNHNDFLLVSRLGGSPPRAQSAGTGGTGRNSGPGGAARGGGAERVGGGADRGGRSGCRRGPHSPGGPRGR